MGNAARAGPNSGCAVCNCEEAEHGEEEALNSYDTWSSPRFLPSPTDEDFCGSQFSERGGASLKQSMQESRREVELRKAQETAKNFVRALIRGHEVNLLSVRGGVVRCMAFLDRQLTTLSLERATEEAPSQQHRRDLELRDIEEVLVGEDGGDEFGLETDGLSVTLVLRSRMGLAFAFDNESDRDTFALCLAMFVDEDHRKEASGIEHVPKRVRGKRAGLRVWEQEDVEEVVVVERGDEDLEELELNPDQMYHPPWEDNSGAVTHATPMEEPMRPGL